MKVVLIVILLDDDFFDFFFSLLRALFSIPKFCVGVAGKEIFFYLTMPPLSMYIKMTIQISDFSIFFNEKPIQFNFFFHKKLVFVCHSGGIFFIGFKSRRPNAHTHTDIQNRASKKEWPCIWTNRRDEEKNSSTKFWNESRKEIRENRRRNVRRLRLDLPSVRCPWYINKFFADTINV